MGPAVSPKGKTKPPRKRRGLPPFPRLALWVVRSWIAEIRSASDISRVGEGVTREHVRGCRRELAAQGFALTFDETDALLSQGVRGEPMAWPSLTRALRVPKKRRPAKSGADRVREMRARLRERGLCPLCPVGAPTPVARGRTKCKAHLEAERARAERKRTLRVRETAPA